MLFDLLISGGHVIDAAAGINGPSDVAIIGDRVAAVDRSMLSRARRERSMQPAGWSRPA
jgi:predicted amidohydrolase